MLDSKHDNMDESSSVPQTSIQAIDKTSVHRICSGQVVLNLATAIKELVENSIDAGATSVEIRLKNYGSELLEVIDNGKGVEQENFAGLTLKHHTSKLQDFSDLVNVDTFGFRGEALSSLCALSKMSIVTCHESVTIGTKLEYDCQGKIVKQVPSPRQKGTTVSLQNLFYTLPVRHKEFLRNLKREFNKAVQVLNAYCIISTGVKITCTNQIGKGKKTTVVCTGGNPTVIENITNIFGAKQAKSLLCFNQSSPNEDTCTEFGITEKHLKDNLFQISGYVSSSEHGCGRSSTDRQFYYINKRPCDPQKISRLVNDVYHMYNRHQYPFVMLDICLAKDSVDVNVTPDKRQIFVQEEKLLLAMLKSSLQNMFEPQSSLYKVNDARADRNSGCLSSWSSKISPCKSQQSGSSSESQKEAKSLVGTLKRRFSSVYAKHTEEYNSDLQPKQRKLDSFLSSKPTHEEPGSSDLESVELLSTCQTPMNSSSESVSHDHCSQMEEFIDTSLIEAKNICNNAIETQQMKPAEEKTETCKKIIPSLADDSVENRVDSECLQSAESGVSAEIGKDTPLNYISNEHREMSPPATQRMHPNFTRNSRLTSINSPLAKPPAMPSSSPSLVMKALQQFRRQNGLPSVLSDIKFQNSDENPPAEDLRKDQSDMDCIDSLVSTQETNSSAEELVRGTANLSETDMVTKYLKSDENVTVTCTEYDEAEELKRKEMMINFSMEKLQQSLRNRESRRQEAKRSRSFHAQIKPTDNQAAEDELKKEISKDMFSKMKIIGQFNLGFIVTLLDRDLFIIDQHATDEKYNFEELQKHTIIQGQRLIQPQNLELTAANECILIDNLEIFHSNGFDFTVDENALPTERVKLVTMPVSKNWTFGKEDIEELIFMLSDSPHVMCRPSRIRQMFASRACRKSIMIGKALNRTEMKKLVCHMGELDQPWNCPHGRPTMRHLINLDMLPD